MNLIVTLSFISVLCVPNLILYTITCINVSIKFYAANLYFYTYNFYNLEFVFYFIFYFLAATFMWVWYLFNANIWFKYNFQITYLYIFLAVGDYYVGIYKNVSA